jgi:hypothetical protein
VTPGGPVDLGSDPDAFGPGVEGTIRRQGVLGGVPVFFGVTGFVAGAQTDSSAGIRFGGRGAFAVNGLTVGGARSDVLATTTNPNAATGDVIVDGVSTVDTGTITNVESTVGGFSASALETLINRGVLASVNVARFDGVPSATSVGVAATDLAFAAAGAGDLSGVEIGNDFDESVLYFGGDAHIGLSALDLGRASLHPFVGLGYRGYRHDIDTTTTVSTPAFAAPGGVVLPAQRSTFAFDEEIDGDYFGAVVGAQFQAPVTERFAFDFNAKAGLFYLDASYSGRQLATVDSGVSVQRIRGRSVSDSADRTAFVGEVGAGLTWIRGNLEISLTGTAEYVSDVPTVDRDEVTAVSVAEDALGQVDGAIAGDLGPNRAAAGLDFEDMWNFGAGLRITARF